ncbi:MAG TPA: hypothetical protein VGH99_12180 [Pseudonocardia sp.]|jgi:hypothetical protein
MKKLASVLIAGSITTIGVFGGVGIASASDHHGGDHGRCSEDSVDDPYCGMRRDHGHSKEHFQREQEQGQLGPKDFTNPATFF